MQWERIKGTLLGRVEHVWRTAVDNRQFVSAVLWVLRTGARWHDLPDRYGNVHTRFMRWARAGVWERLFDDPVADKKNQYLRIDSTIVRAHQQPATGRKRGLRRPGSGAFPRRSEHQDPPDDRRGRAAGRLPHHAGSGCGVRQAIALLKGQEAAALIADKGYDSAEIVAKIGSHCAATTANSTRNDIALNAASTASTLPTLQYTILPHRRSLPLLHSSRMYLAQTPTICRYCLNRKVNQ